MIIDISKENTNAFVVKKELFKKLYSWLTEKELQADIKKPEMCYSYLKWKTLLEGHPPIEAYQNDLAGGKKITTV